MSTVTINMPQMAVRGLSENWLFKTAGDRHWQALCASVGAASDALQDAEGNRLYSSFLAIRARYALPLGEVAENERLETNLALSRFGRSIFASTFTLANERHRLSLDMVTSFVARQKKTGNRLRQSTLRPDLVSTASELPCPPDLLERFQVLRRDERCDHTIEGWPFGPFLAEPPTAVHEPSPYADYNGAGLLYFAAYPTLADTLERRLVHDHGLNPSGMDWSLASSTLARDVFYFRNLDLGGAIRARLRRFRTEDGVATLHMRLEDAADGGALAEIVTVKALAP